MDISQVTNAVKGFHFNILELAVLVLFLALVITGLREGLVRKLTAVLSLVLSVALISVLLPHVTGYLKEHTPVSEMIEEQCRQVLDTQIQNAASALNDTVSTQADAIGRSAGQNVNDFLNTLNLTQEQQTEVIRNMKLPLVIQNQLIRYNNKEGYLSLKVSNFPDFIVRYISGVILKVLAFVIALLLVQVVVRAAFHILHVFAQLPGISLLNRFAGGALGLVEALFVLWVCFLILSLIQGTNIGLKMLSMVQESPVLSWLYEKNLFMRIIL